MTQDKTPSPYPLQVEELMKKNRQAVAEIQESAEELSVVHAVLSTELKAADPSEDAHKAVQHTKDVQAKLEATASELQDATTALEPLTSDKASKG